MDFTYFFLGITFIIVGVLILKFVTKSPEKEGIYSNDFGVKLAGVSCVLGGIYSVIYSFGI